MKTYQYTDTTNTVVAIIDEDGISRGSCLASSLPVGTQIDPCVTPPGVVEKEIVLAVQNRLDTFAKTRNYDGILSACTYATDPSPRFKAEGQYCVDVRSATWAALYALMASVQAGTTPMPTGYVDVEPLLPVLTWPA